MTGGKVEPLVALDVLLYTYCSTFHVDPYIAKDIPMSCINKMVMLHGIVKELEMDEIKKIKTKR